MKPVSETNAGPQSAVKTPSQIRQLDGVRGLAASYVVWHHAYMSVYGPASGRYNNILHRRFLGWLEYGHFAVDVFIVLSGFCLTIPVIRSGGLRGGTLGFLRNRFWRIVPPYECALALSVVLTLTLIGEPTGTHWDNSLGWGWQEALACVLMVPELVHPALNYTFWSVGVEFYIYLFLPIIVICWPRYGLFVPVTVLGALALAVSWWSGGVTLRGMVPWYLALFLMGVLAAWVALDPASPATVRGFCWGWFAAAGALGIGLLACWHGLPLLEQHLILFDSLVGVITACGLLSLVVHPGYVARWIATPVLVRVGSLGYSLYLIHAPLLQVFDQYLVMPWSPRAPVRFLILETIGFATILAASWAFALVCEHPFHRIARSRV